MAISASFAPFSASWSRRTLAFDFGRRRRLPLEALDVGQPEPEIDHLDCVGELIAPRVAPEGADDHEPSRVEIVQHEQWQVVLATDGVDQSPPGGDRHPLVGDDHQVMAVGDVHRPKQRVEAFLLAVQDAGEIARGTDDVTLASGEIGVDDVRPSWPR